MFLTYDPYQVLTHLFVGRGARIVGIVIAMIDVTSCGHLFFDREDFEKTGVSNLVTVGVRDIQGEGFPDEFARSVDSVFLDLPQPWLAIPSAAKMLKQDGVLCSFSPCIEQVQRSCETLKSDFTGKLKHFAIRFIEIGWASKRSCAILILDSIGNL